MNERSLRWLVNDLEKPELVIPSQEQSLNRQKFYRPSYELLWDMFTETFPECNEDISLPCAENVRPCDNSGHMDTTMDGSMLINSKSLTVNTSSNEDVVAIPKVSHRKPNRPVHSYIRGENLQFA